MYKQDSPHRVLLDYKITITERKMERRHKPNSYSQWNIPDPYVYNYMEEEVVPVLKVEIQEAEFTKMANILCEFNDLMKDPETAQLLMEARFINRLKGNR